MGLMEIFRAWGHPNIRASHRTTLMITKEEEVTPRGDCVVAVAAEKGLKDLSSQVKEAIRREGAKISLFLEAEDLIFKVSGFGDPRLPLSHPTDIVVRKSGYICGRTLMVKADKAASDIPSPLLKLLRKVDQEVIIRLIVKDEP